MNLYQTTSRRPAEKSLLLQPRSCPFGDLDDNICRASASAMSLDSRKRVHYCCSDNYDNCPLFLCQVLRGSRPLYRGVDRGPLTEK